jgi:glycosyltransferase involved in cell wall biosynthesis
MTLRVITATRGYSAHLGLAAASVTAIPGTRHVLVCPPAMGAELARQFPGGTLLAESGKGLYAALNTGLDASGDEELVTWINDDDLLAPPGIATARELLARDATLGAVYGRVELIDTAGKRLGELPVARRADDLLPLITAGLMPLAQPGTIFRRSALAGVGRFDPSFRLAGDLDLFARALRTGLKFGFVDEVVARFRLHGGQLSKDEAAAAAEHARVVSALPPRPSFGATLRFRAANVPVYVERIRRHGFKRMHTLYRHE